MLLKILKKSAIAEKFKITKKSIFNAQVFIKITVAQAPNLQPC